MMGKHILKHYSSTQPTVALSSGEAEFYALVKGGSQALGMRSMLRDLSVHVNIKLLTDATTGKAIVSRRGIGRLRHIDVADLWIQQHVKDGDLDVVNLKNSFNSSGAMTN